MAFFDNANVDITNKIELLIYMTLHVHTVCNADCYCVNSVTLGVLTHYM